MAKLERTGYNAGMGQVDKWLSSGSRVVASSDRAARAVLAAYHRERRSEGKSAWSEPSVQSWQVFVQKEWQSRAEQARLLLNPTQEESLWAQVIQRSEYGVALLDGPLRRLAGLAMEAHGLLCAYAPKYLEPNASRNWEQDAAAFRGWLAEFQTECDARDAVSTAQVAAELVVLLEKDASAREPLLLVGIDRLTPMQRGVLDAWGEWRVEEAASAAHDVAYFAATDASEELESCAAWCRRELEANPEARLLVVTQDAKQRRGEIERAFLHEAARNNAVQFEFSLGVPLATVAIVRGAYLLLRWLDNSPNSALAEHELDWLFSTPYCGSAQEAAALRAFHRALRQRGLQRTAWMLEEWLSQRTSSASLPAAWTQRIIQAQRLLRESAKGRLSPLEWCALTPRLLQAAGWPAQALSSTEFQALRRWEQALDTVGSLGYDEQRIDWQRFLAELGSVLQATLFAVESENAPILIAGPAESAGITADAIWFLGADEDAWPGRAQVNPLIPIQVQRTAKMPHSMAQLDAELARTITLRLLSSAEKIRFSYARQKDDVDSRPSRIVMELAGGAQPIPNDLKEKRHGAALVERVEDTDNIALQIDVDGVHGGSAVLTSQSQCPFQAFATARLDARGWDAAESGLTAAERGNLLHEVMHAIWGGKVTDGIRTAGELAQIADMESFVQAKVEKVMREKVPAAVREQMPERYLQLEAERLIKLVTMWLKYEAARLPFRVEETEVKKEITIAGLALRLRLDRVDALNDGTLLVIDYKTGNAGPKQWELPRPDDVQLPLYAGFALPEGSELGGLAFAKLRVDEIAFAGCVGDAKATLLPDLKANSGLVANALTAEKLIDWRNAIEALARDFLTGKAQVDPKNFPKTCENCGLQAVCRVHEQPAITGRESEEETANDAD